MPFHRHRMSLCAGARPNSGAVPFSHCTPLRQITQMIRTNRIKRPKVERQLNKQYFYEGSTTAYWHRAMTHDFSLTNCSATSPICFLYKWLTVYVFLRMYICGCLFDVPLVFRWLFLNKMQSMQCPFCSLTRKMKRGCLKNDRNLYTVISVCCRIPPRCPTNWNLNRERKSEIKMKHARNTHTYYMRDRNILLTWNFYQNGQNPD